MKNVFLYLKLILLLIVLVWIIKSVNLKESYEVLTKTNLLYFLIAFLFNNVSNIILTIKWHRLASPLKIKSSFFELLKLNYVSMFYSIFVPGQASGEIIKGLKLIKVEGSHQKIWIPIFIDKVTNLLVMLLIGFVAILLDKNFNQNTKLIFSISLITSFVFLLTIALFSEHTQNFVENIKKFIINILKLIKLDTKVIEGFSINYFEEYKKHNLLMFETLIWSTLIKLPHVIAYFFIALSLNLNINFIQSAWLYSLVTIISLLPISFSGLGIREGTVILLLTQLNINSPSALSFSVLIFINGVLLGLIGGILEILSTIKKQKNERKR